MFRLLVGFLKKDARVFGADKQAVVMSFVIPILVATILGWLDLTATENNPGQKVQFYLASEDSSAVSKQIVARLEKNDNVKPELMDASAAQAKVKNGGIAAIIPPGFGEAAVAAMTGGPKPTITLLTDPSKESDGQIVEGALYSETATVAAKEAFGSLIPDPSPPLTVNKVSSAAHHVKWGQSAHDFAGFGLMGLLFFAIESGISLVKDRRAGIWRRLRASPVDPRIFILARGVSSTILALAIILVMFGFGALAFGIRILGSVSGFFLVAVGTALMAACFGLLVASLGRSENQARGVATLAIFVMLASGGAWFPLSRMPDWVQNGALYLPVRWSVEGFDAMTWRGLSLSEGASYAGMLTIFAAVFLGLALAGARLRAEE